MVGIVSGSLSNFLRTNLTSENKEILATTAQISSGEAITRTADDAAGLAIGIGLQVQTSTLTTALSNISQASTVNEISGGAINDIQNLLERAKELATQASQETLSDDDRAALQTEFSEILESIQTISENTNFNGTELLKNNDGFEFQISLESTETVALPSIDITLSSLFSSSDLPSIDTLENTTDAISSIDNALNLVTDISTQITTSNTFLDTVSNNINVAIQNIEASRSLLLDTDIGEATQANLESILKANFNIALQAHSNDENLQNTLSLLEE